MLYGKGIKHNYRIQNASIIDVAPTLLYLMGLPIADDMDGRLLKEAFHDPIDDEDIMHVASYNALLSELSEDRIVFQEFDETTKSRLRSLGYLN